MMQAGYSGRGVCALTVVPSLSPPVLVAPAPLTVSRRVEWVNYAKGLGIILVVVGHAWRGLATLATPGQAHVMSVVDTAIYQFHMPLFFVLSGLFVAHSAQRPLGKFVLQKFRTIAYPYVLWTLIQTAIASEAGSAAHHKMSFLAVVKHLPYQPVGQFWFLYVLLMCMLAFGLLSKARLGNIPILIIAIALYVARHLVHGMEWGPLYQFSADFVYFAAGAVLAPMVLARITKIDWPLLLIPSAAMFAIIAILAASSPGVVRMNDITVTAAMGIIATAGLAVVLTKTPGTGILSVLGEASLAIYVAHIVFAAAARTVLLKLHITDLPLQLLVGVLVGLGAPLLLFYVSRRMKFQYLFTL